MDDIILHPVVPSTGPEPITVTGDKKKFLPIEGRGSEILKRFHGIGELRKKGYSVSALEHAVVFEM